MRRGFEIFEWFFTIADINDQIRPFVCVLYLEHDNPVHLRSPDRVEGGYFIWPNRLDIANTLKCIAQVSKVITALSTQRQTTSTGEEVLQPSLANSTIHSSEAQSET